MKRKKIAVLITCMTFASMNLIFAQTTTVATPKKVNQKELAPNQKKEIPTVISSYEKKGTKNYNYINSKQPVVISPTNEKGAKSLKPRQQRIQPKPKHQTIQSKKRSRMTHKRK